MELYTVKQVAHKLGLKPRTVQGYIRDGKLNAIKWTKGYRITDLQLDSFIEKIKKGE